MAFYDANRNRIYKPFVRKEPVYGETTTYPDHMQLPMPFREEGGEQHAIVSQSYMITTHEEVVKFRREDDRKHYGPTRKELYKDHGAGDNKPPYAPWSSAEKDREPRFHKDQSPPPRDHYYHNPHDYGKYNHLSSEDDDGDENDNGDIAHNYKMDAKPKVLSYDKEKNKKNSYAPPGYPVPYHDKTSYNDNNDKHIGNNGYVPPKVKILPQIKTRIGDPEFANANNKKPTNSNASPTRGQGHHEVINSTEARRQYDKPPPRAGPDVEEMSNGIIDCREAARKYNGLFVSK